MYSVWCMCIGMHVEPLSLHEHADASRLNLAAFKSPTKTRPRYDLGDQKDGGFVFCQTQQRD